MNMNLLELITTDNIHELQPGEWIWDNKLIERTEHAASIDPKPIVEPIGFRQIDILDLKDFHRFSWTPFMLTNIDSSYPHRPHSWVYWENNRFYRFRKE